MTVYIIFVSENAYIDLLGEHDIPQDNINEHHDPMVDRERRDAPLPSLAERQGGGNSSDPNNDRTRIFEKPWVRLY